MLSGAVFLRPLKRHVRQYQAKVILAVDNYEQFPLKPTEQ